MARAGLVQAWLLWRGFSMKIGDLCQLPSYGMLGSICGSQKSTVNQKEWCLDCLSHWFPAQPPSCTLDAATRLALGSPGAGCQQDGRRTGWDQVSEAKANSLHSCPSLPPLASLAPLGPSCQNLNLFLLFPRVVKS